jgi:hypothetical protein
VNLNGNMSNSSTSDETRLDTQPDLKITMNSNKNESHIMKKHSRMIKNRESACLSRKRKKEYMQTIEENLQEVTLLNESLKKQNQELKERILVLEAENKVYKQYQQQQQAIKLDQPNSFNFGNKLSFKAIKTVLPPSSATPNSNINATKFIATKNQLTPNINGGIGLKRILTPATTTSTATTASLKRPFIMLAVLFVVGLNIFQFTNVTTNYSTQTDLSPAQFANRYTNQQSSDKASQLAALRMANVESGALIDLNPGINSRHLLNAADDDYDDFSYDKDGNQIKKLSKSPQDNEKKSSPKSDTTKLGFNLTKKSNESMELVLINGTWHLIDLNVCYNMLLRGEEAPKNNTHVHKINSHLNDWFDRHGKMSQHRDDDFENTHDESNNLQKTSNLKAILVKKTMTAKRLSKFEDATVKYVNEKRIVSQLNNDNNKKEERKYFNRKEESSNEGVYPMSLYSTQTKQHESFMKFIRQRDDTYYYVSFRRDHVTYSALHQNKTKKPRMTIVIPALLSHLNDSNNKDQHISFIQIDCEVTDTRFLNIKLDDIPLDYKKILHQDYILNEQNQNRGGSEGQRDSSSFY